MSKLRSFAAIAAAVVSLAIPALAAPDLGPDLPDGVQLNRAITINGGSVHLGDVFSGLSSYQDRVVAPSPRPGERSILSPDFLANLARTYSVDWQPTDQFDRAIVYRPGQILTPAQILAALKADLRTKGLPEQYGLHATSVLPTMTVPADVAMPITVREGIFDPASKAFSAVLEISEGDSPSQFLQFRGTAFPTVTVPVLKAEVGHTSVITADMLEEMDVPQDQIRSDTIFDVAMLIGLSPRGFVRPEHPIRQSEVGRLNLVDVPVLKSDMRRDSVISDSSIEWMTVNAAELPNDAVVNKEYLIGKSPRSVVAGGAPIRRGDVMATRQVAMAVAARDLPLGTLLQKADINWVSVSDNDLEFGVVTDEDLLRGRATTRPVRAGQALRPIDLTRPKVITRGKSVMIVYTTGSMHLTVQGEALEDGGMSDIIRVSNIKSQTAVQAEVIDANTVRVSPQQSAMQ